MAVPTKAEEFVPNHSIRVTGTNVDAGTFDYTLNYNQSALRCGFSVITGTLTAMTVTVFATNWDGGEVDITSDLFGVSALASSKAYICDIPLPSKNIIVRATRTNATNEINLTVFAPKR